MRCGACNIMLVSLSARQACYFLCCCLVVRRETAVQGERIKWLSKIGPRDYDMTCNLYRSRYRQNQWATSFSGSSAANLNINKTQTTSRKIKTLSSYVHQFLVYFRLYSVRYVAIVYYAYSLVGGQLGSRACVREW